MKEILTLLIVLGNIYSVKNDSESATMINFEGSAKSELFEGKVLPGAVDTQVNKIGQHNCLSERYMLEGVDSTGQACRVFIENNVTPTTPVGQTEPKIISNSKVITEATKGKLSGKIAMNGGNLSIHIYAEE